MKAALTGPIPLMSAANTSPGAIAIIGPRAPERMTSPARSGLPRSRTAAASQATAASGWPRQAAPVPVETTSSPRRMVMSQAARSTRSSRCLLSPSTNRPDEALSATVSTMLMSQPAMRLSTISSAATT